MYLGRWSIVESSDEYIRSAWHVVTSLQLHVIRQTVRDPAVQEIGLDEMDKELKARGWQEPGG